MSEPDRRVPVPPAAGPRRPPCVALALAWLVGAGLVTASCSGGATGHDHDAPLGDAGNADRPASDGRPGDALGPLDGPSTDGPGLTCEPSAALLARIDPARMSTDLGALTGLPGRSSDAQQAQAVGYLRTQLSTLPDVAVRDRSYAYGGTQYVNLEATIAGTSNPARFVMAGAHYDAVAGSQGADDDASGTVAVLEAARALAGCRPPTSIRLLFFSNEEQGTVGSTAYVADFVAEVPPSQVVGFINADMIAHGPPDAAVQIETRPAYAAFATAMEQAVTAWTPLTVLRNVSDHCG